MKNKSIRRALREPSTWAGIAGPIGVLGTQLQGNAASACFIFSALCGVMAVILREQAPHDGGL